MLSKEYKLNHLKVNMVKIIGHNPDLLVEDFLRLKYVGAYVDDQFKDFLKQNGFSHLPSIYFSIIFNVDKDNNLIEISTDIYSDKNHTYYNENEFNYQNEKGEWLYTCFINFMESKGYPFKRKIKEQSDINKFVETLKKEGFKNFDWYFKIDD